MPQAPESEMSKWLRKNHPKTNRLFSRYIREGYGVILITKKYGTCHLKSASNHNPTWKTIDLT